MYNRNYAVFKTERKMIKDKEKNNTSGSCETYQNVIKSKKKWRKTL